MSSQKTVTPIVQFGTSRFLQAHADWFLTEARAGGQDVGPVTVVQTTGSGARSGRLAAFDGTPIPVVVRDMLGPRPVRRRPMG
jgi:tagaturonate reductase